MTSRLTDLPLVGRFPLGKLWKIQEDFYQKIRKEKMEMTDQEFAYSLILHLYHEVTELLDGVGGAWKTHIDDGVALKKSQVLGEVVDITKLAWETAQVFGITEEEFYQAFIDKSQVVENRRKANEFLNSDQGPTIVFDVDGVLTQYPESFFAFVNDVTGSKYSVNDIKSPDNIWVEMGIPVAEYQKLKSAFWEQNGGEMMPPVAWPADTILYARDLGFKVIAVTSRDKKSLEKMELATYRWLDLWSIDLDGVFFDQDKARFIRRHIKSPCLFIDDNFVEVGRAREAGIESILVRRPYNPDGSTYPETKDIIRKIAIERSMLKEA